LGAKRGRKEGEELEEGDFKSWRVGRSWGTHRKKTFVGSRGQIQGRHKSENRGENSR